MTARSSPRPRLWTRQEYNRLGEEGIFHPEEKLELIDGVIYRKAWQTPRHCFGICVLVEELTPLFSAGYEIRQQFPLAFGEYSEPEPDIAVVSGSLWDYLDAHPTFAVLVVEVADGSLLHDRKKAELYARTGIPEYWLLNLVGGCLEVYRDPKDGIYTSCFVLCDGESISPLSRPEAAIAIANLFAADRGKRLSAHQHKYGHENAVERAGSEGATACSLGREPQEREPTPNP